MLSAGLLAAGVFVVFVGGLRFSLPHVLANLADASTHLHENADEAERRLYGDAFAAGIAEVRRLVPRDGAYFLLDGGGQPGAALWARYLLAPRRCEYLGKRVGSRTLLEREGRPPRLLPYVVITSAGDTPIEIVESRRFFEGYEPFDPGRLDDAIPASIDAPPEDARVAGPLEVRGWCQEKGGRPCAGIRIQIDGSEIRVAVERLPRPDVEQAVPGIGRADHAGYRALVPFGAPGSHRLTVYFLTADGRYRRLGPRLFRWAP